MSTGNIAPARRRFWVVVLCFAVANLAAWVAYDRHVRRGAQGLLRVESFEPGEDVSVGRRQALRWRFNTDVIPTTAYGRDPATVTPAVAGHWAWENPRTLTFTPDSDLPEATRISFTLAGTFLRSSMGATLPGPYTSSVRIMPLSLESVQQSGTLPNDRYLVELRFNDRVVPAEVLKHLALADDHGNVVRCELVGHPADNIVRVATEPLPAIGDPRRPAAASLKVTLEAGLCARGGNLAMADSVSQAVDLSRQLAATELTAEAPLASPPALHLSFTGHVAPSALQQIISIEPKVDFTLQGDGNSQYSLRGDFQPQTRYTLTLAAAPKGADPAEYPLPAHLSAFIPDRQSGVWFDNDQGYLSSAGNRTLLAHTVNLDSVRVVITRVYDNNLVEWRNAGRSYRWADLDAYAKPVVEKLIAVSKEKNVQHDVRLSLDALLPADAAHDGVYRIAVAAATPPAVASTDDDGDDQEEAGAAARAYAVATLSDIALTAKQVRDGMVVWATSIRSAEPIARVHVRVYSTKNQPLGEAMTDRDGLARITGIHPAKDESIAVVLAERAPAPASNILGPTLPAPVLAAPATADLTWLDVRRNGWEMGDLPVGGREYLRNGYEAYVYTDRGVYRPGEAVHLRAILRGSDHRAPGASFPVCWQLRRPDQQQWQSKVVMLDADGAASLDVQLLPDLPTGEWTATLDLPGAARSADGKPFGSATFSVEEFVPSRMKVKLAFDHAGDAGSPVRGNLANGPLTAQVQGDYLFGRPAAGLTTELSTHFEPVAFSPAGWSDWAFGDTAHARGELPAIVSHSRHKLRDAADRPAPTEVILDNTGHYLWSIDADASLGVGNTDFRTSTAYAGPWRLTASAGVREAGGRAITAWQHIDIDALPSYLAVRRDGSAGDAKPGLPCPIQIRVVRPDGQQASSDAAVAVSLLRESWNTTLVFRNGEYGFDSTRVLEPIQSKKMSLADGKGDWSPTIPADGDYLVTAQDLATGAFTSITFPATDGMPWDDNISRANPEHLDVRLLSPSDAGDHGAPTDGSPAFTVGHSAKVAIGSPFAGRLLLTVETDDVLFRRVIDMRSTHVVVPIPVTEACRPNAFVTATVTRAVDPNSKWQAHRAFGATRLRVDPADRALHVAITAPSEIRPLQSLDVNLLVTDSTGQPAASTAITVAAVDEGICQLTNFPTPDPMGFFNGDRALAVSSFDIFDLLMPEVPRPGGERAVGGDRAAGLGRHITPIVAQRFKPVALPWQTVHTDANGWARASFSVPEFQGKLRVMAVAYDASATGSGDAPVIVRSPIVAQSTWPRFAAPGDQFSVPVVLFNNTASAGAAIISADIAENEDTPSALIGFGADHRQSITLPAIDLPAMGQRQVYLPASAGQAVGVAKLHLHVVLNGDVYDEHLELPVRPPAPRMQFGGTLMATPAKPTPLAPPMAMMAGTEALAIHITPWPSLHLNEALDYLDRYPFGCVEQTTSGCFPLLTLNAIGKDLDPKRFDPNAIKLKIASGIDQLLAMQTSSGGLAMWPGENDPWPWGSIYAAHFLVEARSAGFEAPEDLYQPLLAYVRRLLNDDTDDSQTLERQAYADLVLCLAGTPDRASLSRLEELASALNPTEDDQQRAMRSNAAMLLACAWTIAGRPDLAEPLLPDSLPAPRAQREKANNIGSPIRDRALLIYTLASVRPADPRLPALVQALADTGLRQQWDTQECAFATLAIGKYLEHAPKPAAYDRVALLGGSHLLARAMRGHSIDWSEPSRSLDSPTSITVLGPPHAAAYVSWMQSGVPLAPPADAFHGIVIHRQYLTAAGTPVAQNSIPTGELVRIRLTVEAPAGEQNLVIEDLLPAGLEAENGALKTSAAQRDSPRDDADSTDSDNSAHDAVLHRIRMEVRDDRVIVMGDMSASGSAAFEYLARAVTPGIYVIPPVRAEAMYDIAQNGLSGAGGTFTVQLPPMNFANSRD